MNGPDLPLPEPLVAAQQLQAAIGQIEFARRYTLELLDATPQDRWFEMPAGISTHIAWQVGHLAVSQYGLLMFRIRGRDPDDLTLVKGRFRKAYARASTPSADPSSQPSAGELLERLQQIHQRALGLLRSLTPDVLLEPVDEPYAVFPIKLGAILFCPLHEHIHVGQIGVIRRALGLDPIR